MEDRHAVYDVLVRYVNGIDRHDFDEVAACFAEDAQAVYGGLDAGHGRDAIVAYLRRAHTATASTHLIGGVRIEVAGDRADSDSSVVAFLVNDGKLRVRGLRYVDRFRRLGGEWQITDRVHSAAWMAETPALG